MSSSRNINHRSVLALLFAGVMAVACSASETPKPAGSGGGGAPGGSGGNGPAGGSGGTGSGGQAGG
ncbi:MAG TPA: hypothetical protein VFH73_08145, partial [Polyangia bacterium]|nr:hypothetical protein [Polyangia bacterium]